MKSKIITVSREFGSGGRTIAGMVAKKIGIPCYDKEIIDKVAEESGFAKEYIEQQGEYSAHRTWIGRSLAATGVPGGFLSNQDNIWLVQRKIILGLAQEGPCVIVGRCADYILKDEAELLKVFIHADTAFRAERIVKEYGERDRLPEKRLADKDKRRIAYYRYYTETEWGIAKNYHISLDSGKIGLERCAEIIASLY